MESANTINHVLKAWCNGDEYTLSKVASSRIILEEIRGFVNRQTRVTSSLMDATIALAGAQASFMSVSDLWFATAKAVLLFLSEILNGPFEEAQQITYVTGEIKVDIERIETEYGPVYSLLSYRDKPEGEDEYHRHLSYNFLHAITHRSRGTRFKLTRSIYGYSEPTMCFSEAF